MLYKIRNYVIYALAIAGGVSSFAVAFIIAKNPNVCDGFAPFGSCARFQTLQKVQYTCWYVLSAITIIYFYIFYFNYFANFFAEKSYKSIGELFIFILLSFFTVFSAVIIVLYILSNPPIAQFIVG